MPSPKSKAPKAKLPKHATARIMYCNVTDLVGESTFDVNKSEDSSDDRLWTHPVLVKSLAHLTPEERKGCLRWERLSEEEKVEAMAKTLWHAGNPAHNWHSFGKPFQGRYRETARAILSLQSSPAKGGRVK